MVKTKSRSVVFTELTPGLAHLLYYLEDFHRKFFAQLVPQLVITSMNDSTHGENSRHYTNEAIDIRSHNFPNREMKRLFRVELEKHLGPRFRVLLENVGTSNEHFHVQVKKGMQFL
jgi:hypothetical protein